MEKETRPNKMATDLSSGRKKAFTFVLVLFPLLFLLLLELGLRLGHYGGNLDLFIPGPGRMNSYYICNHDVARRYFIGMKQVPTPGNDFFARLKPANGFRLFVLGGSTAAGYPYGENLMFSRILQHELQQKMPDKKVEIINVAMSAVNSYTLLDFMDEILAQQPDAILVYAGHNEFYGALGAASMINIGRTRAFVVAYLKLSRLKTFLAVRNLVYKLRKLGSKKAAPTATLMERMASKRAIPLNSTLYKQGVEQFRGNLKAIILKAQKKNVPIILSELVSNIADQPPFIAVPEPQNADTIFQLGKELQEKNQFDRARETLTQAKDLDALRFRAPSEFNEIINDLADTYQAPVVAMDSAFRAQSPNGLIGDALMIDHLHPNHRGYFIMAEAFRKKLASAGIIPATNKEPGEEQLLAKKWRYTALDSVYADLSVRVLKGGWPFRRDGAPNTFLQTFQPQDIIEETAKKVIKYDNVSLRRGHELLAEHYEKSGMEAQAQREWQALVAFQAWSPKPYLKMAEWLVRHKQPNKVPSLVETSLLFDESPLPYILLGEAQNLMGAHAKAIEAFALAERAGASSNDPHILLGRLQAYEATGQTDKAQAIREQMARALPRAANKGGQNRVALLLQEANRLIHENRFEQALVPLQQSLTLQETSHAHLMLGQIYLKQRNPQMAVKHLERANELAPDQPLQLYNLAIGLVQLQNYVKAWAVLEELHQVAPHFKDPYDLRKKIAAILNK